MSVGSNLRRNTAAVEAWLIEHLHKSWIPGLEANFRVAASLSARSAEFVNAVEVKFCTPVENIIKANRTNPEFQPDYQEALEKLRDFCIEFKGAARQVLLVAADAAEYSRAHPFRRITDRDVNNRAKLIRDMSSSSLDLLNKRDHITGIIGCMSLALIDVKPLPVEQGKVSASHKAEKFDIGYSRCHAQSRPEVHSIKIGGMVFPYRVSSYRQRVLQV